MPKNPFEFHDKPLVEITFLLVGDIHMDLLMIEKLKNWFLKVNT